MAVATIFVLALLAGSTCSAIKASRIVGGDSATINQFPAIVQVEFRFVEGGLWSQNCAANILNSRYTLSAAHCFEGPAFVASYRRIRAGATYRNEGGSVYYINNAVNHHDYGLLGYDSDISVVRLETPFTYSPYIQAVPIIAYGYNVPDNIPVVLAGWGTTEQAGPVSLYLQKTTIYTVNREECARRYLNATWPAEVTKNMICAGILDVGGKGSCQGDAGGPVYYQGVLVGVISWGNGCARPEYPSVSTAVSPFTPWIVDHASN